MDVKELIRQCNSRDLKRAYNSQKQFLYFNFDIFNTGVRAYIICTNRLPQINPDLHNGYDFFLHNDYDTMVIIGDILLEKNVEIKKTLK